MFQKGYLYLLLVAIAVVVAIWEGIQLSCLDISGIIYPFLLLTVAVPIIICRMMKDPPSLLFHCIAIPVCLLALIIQFLVAETARFFGEATTVVTNIQRYDEILAKLRPHGLTDHFPAIIPSEAKNLRFSFRPQFLQGGGYIQLRYSLPPAELNAAYTKFSDLKTCSYFGGNAFTHVTPKGGMPTTSFYTNDNKNPKSSESWDFPDDYEMMVFDQIRSQENPQGGLSWNHGRTHGVAISRQRSELVYWAEFW